jgi:flavin reductase (DIM6/NTAB) family NADH-FMN oxidoreductase RutF
MSIDSREFRDALGCFATGVCVVTGSLDKGHAFGITVNSFASVSLDPPLILWSLQNDSEMFEAFEHCTRWAVNILRSDQEDLSSRYARRGGHQLDPAHVETGAAGMPVMPDSLVSLECELEARYPGGDHVILLARVLEMTHRSPGNPLVFCAGGYRQLAG